MKDLSNLPYRKGVGIMLLNQETKVFIGKRIDSTKAWQMPQGGVDQKEDVLNAAKRELKEETGITSIEIIKKSEKEFVYDLPNELLGKINQKRNSFTICLMSSLVKFGMESIKDKNKLGFLQNLWVRMKRLISNKKKQSFMIGVGPNLWSYLN